MARAKKHKWTIQIGDWSNDGHGKCSDKLIESNLTNEEIRFIIKNIPLDLRNLANQKIADVFINVYEYSQNIKNLNNSERIYIFVNQLSENDIKERIGFNNIPFSK